MKWQAQNDYPPAKKIKINKNDKTKTKASILDDFCIQLQSIQT
jgi:hypothetical protein